MAAITPFIFIIILFLSGCNTFAPHPPTHLSNVSWKQRQAQLSHLNQWSNSGVVGMRTPAESWSATYQWAQQPAQFRLQLFAPLGAGSLLLTGNSQQTELITSKGEHYQSKDPQSLLLERTGWNLPVKLLRYWVLGVPAPGIPSKLSFDKFHRPTALKQSGWSVNYQQYQVIDNIELPTRLVLSNNYFKIRLVIKHWNI